MAFNIAILMIGLFDLMLVAAAYGISIRIYNHIRATAERKPVNSFKCETDYSFFITNEDPYTGEWRN